MNGLGYSNDGGKTFGLAITMDVIHTGKTGFHCITKLELRLLWAVQRDFQFRHRKETVQFATVIVPLGARLDDSPIEALDAYLTVESVNQGSIYVQSDAAMAAYGVVLQSQFGIDDFHAVNRKDITVDAHAVCID